MDVLSPFSAWSVVLSRVVRIVIVCMEGIKIMAVQNKAHQLPRLGRVLLLSLAFFMPLATCAKALTLNYEAYRTSASSLVALKPGDFVRSGEKIAIKISYINGDWSAIAPGSLVFTLPPGFRFVGSGQSGSLSISDDGGHHFFPVRALHPQPASFAQAASGETITYMKWALLGAVAPGQSGEINLVAVQE